VMRLHDEPQVVDDPHGAERRHWEGTW
jgi:hypothetical protein